MTGTDRPLLFLDVDGPLIPFGAPPPGGYPTYRSPYGSGTATGGNPLVARVDPALGPRLLSLPCEPVWATTWLADANHCLAPWLGLPQLPVVDWPVEEEDEPGGVHWKTRTLVAWAAGRPFAWVDDEITEADRRWVAAHSPARTLLHRVDPQRGLTEEDFTALGTWLRTT
ncbi:HAD domain-containing protein [Kitasatospora sp. NPDC096140]|uniref:HAD domain-containing protein n=1 Tax=Kitasatospora sp. NPDC096140 TaxID=3155425 RepID=UPI003322F1B2